MRVDLIALVVLAGCYDPIVPAGAPCTVDRECPGGQACVERFCRAGAAPPDAGAEDLDLDDDGVANAQDNCPTASNVDQADEDGDREGDACDGCPTVAKQASDVDADADQLLDVAGCDPDPTRASAVWQFFPFNAAPDTTNKSADWTVRGGSYESDVAAVEHNFSFVNADFIANRLDFSDFTASTALAIQPNPGAEYSAGLILIDWRVAGEVGDVYCELFEFHGARNLRIRQPGVSSVEAASPLAWTSGTDYRISFRYRAGHYTCSAVTPDGTLHTVEADSTNQPGDGKAVTMYTDEADTLFRWLFVAGPRP